MSDEGGGIFGHGPLGSSGGGDAGDNIGAVDLNLTPLMDVLSNILFFLLASFGAAILSYLAASVPIQAEGDESQQPEPRLDKVVVNVQIMKDAYRINLSSDDVDPEKMNKYRQTLPRTEEGYDTKQLGELINAIKEEFPASDTAMIVPNTETTYDEIVLTMEAVKDRPTEDPDKPDKLLPKMVIADIVRADTAAGSATEGKGK
jgi:biopolymer transport protein ExbD